MPPTPPPPIDKVDPARAWQPWEPTAKDSFSLRWAGHLFRRAGLGTGLGDLRAAVGKGLDATLKRLLEGDEGAEVRERLLVSVGDKMVSDDKPDELRGWWVYCMIHNAYPLREKLTLFWHNHFATSIAKVGRPTLMYAQNKLLRKHALGSFRGLLKEVSRDPAMIVWLDNNANVKGKPNENYAREVMELFSLGVGNYTEKDVREAARAFTGWHTNEAGDRYEFNAKEHDDGPKTVLAQTGNWNGDDVVRILLEQPQAARFLVRKLYRYLVSETHDPPATLLEPLAESFRKSDYDMTALLKTMLRSRHFFSEYAYRQRLKCPVEFVLGAARAVAHTTEEQDTVRLPPGPLANRMAAMGQDLFAPPNVKGWAYGKAWLNTSTVLARNNFAGQVASGRVAVETYDPPALDSAPAFVPNSPEPDAVYDPADLVKQAKLTEPAKVVDFLLDLFLQGDAPAPARAKLVAFVAEGKPKDKALGGRVREAAHTIMCMPEYQLA
jgi:uncharacterized protein (DUF1800 family)